MKKAQLDFFRFGRIQPQICDDLSFEVIATSQRARVPYQSCPQGCPMIAAECGTWARPVSVGQPDQGLARSGEVFFHCICRPFWVALRDGVDDLTVLLIVDADDFWVQR